MKTDNTNITIGSRIKEAREGAHMSQADLAKALDYESSTAISLIESGERKLRVEDLQKVADALHRNVDYFLGQESKSSDVKTALRADKDLGADDQKKVLEFIEFVKQKKNGK